MGRAPYDEDGAVNWRPGFAAIASGWMLFDDWDDLTARIERLAEWKAANGPLLEVEEATVKVMIARQVATAPDMRQFFHQLVNDGN